MICFNAPFSLYVKEIALGMFDMITLIADKTQWHCKCNKDTHGSKNSMAIAKSYNVQGSLAKVIRYLWSKLQWLSKKA
jgi:hypothetical protein